MRHTDAHTPPQHDTYRSPHSPSPWHIQKPTLTLFMTHIEASLTHFHDTSMQAVTNSPSHHDTLTPSPFTTTHTRHHLRYPNIYPSIQLLMKHTQAHSPLTMTPAQASLTPQNHAYLYMSTNYVHFILMTQKLTLLPQLLP
jgi:hypothetical protein